MNLRRLPHNPLEPRVLCFLEHIRIVAVEVQPSALVALQGAANYQICRNNKIAQLDQIVANTEIRVELFDLTG